jgi:hypothetical protein
MGTTKLPLAERIETMAMVETVGSVAPCGSPRISGQNGELQSKAIADK